MGHVDAKIASFIKCMFESFMEVGSSLVNVNSIVDSFVVSSELVTSNRSFCSTYIISQKEAIRKKILNLSSIVFLGYFLSLS